MRTSCSRALALRALALLPLAAIACGLESISTGGKGGGADAGTAARHADADAAAIEGAGCGREAESGLTLCAATSVCPNVVVDVEAFPHCGFRIDGASVDLVCGCTGSGAICPMGSFTTCAQAAQLLTSQTEQGVCMQVAEGRCLAGASGGASSSGGTCDRQCLSDCGGGAACASVCGC